MCATQLNHLVHAGVLAQDAVIRVTEFIGAESNHWTGISFIYCALTN